MKILLTAFLFVISFMPVKAERVFNLSSDLLYAYDKILNLELVEAKAIIEKHKRLHPNNAMPYFIENYVDFITIFIDENETEFNRLKKNKEVRLNILEKADKNSPYYLYTQAEIRLQWAITRVKFKEYSAAFFEVSKAFTLLEKNMERYPGFISNKRSLGVLHTVIGNIPDNYKWGVKLIGGLDGTVSQGLAELKEVLDYSKTNYYPFERETIVLYSLLNLHIANKKQLAWDIIKNPKLNPRESPLACYIQSSVAMRTGRNDLAIDMLINRPKGDRYYSFHFLDYLLGLALTYKLDDEADYYLKKYLLEFKGRNYIKETYQKLGWISLMNDNPKQYHQRMEQLKVKGHNDMDEDDQAQYEAESGKMPHKEVLRARLLYDGGYYERALKQVQSISEISLPSEINKIEYYYRYGRILETMGRYDEAIPWLKKAIEKGRYKPEYFACNAALQMGHIYEKKKQLDLAKQYFKTALSMTPSQYKKSLHARAKAGINRTR